jgi:invasion protein IalB
MLDVSKPRFTLRVPSFGNVNWGRAATRAGTILLLLAAGGAIALAGERLLGGGIAPGELRIRTFMDWRVVCPAITPQTPDCALTTEVQRDTGGVLLTVSMTDPTPGQNLTLTVPHGVMLESGLGFSIGTEPVRVRPYETCTVAGCIALVTVDADTLKSLVGNMGGQVAVAAPNNPQPINIPFSLRGFAEGFDELERARARRTGLFSFLRRS